MPKLTFNDEKHEYRLDGEKLISVTTVLREAKLFDYFALDTTLAMEKGTAVHTLTELDDQGAIDPSKMINSLAGHLDGWRRFKEDSKLEILGTEEAVYHPIYKYAGKLDRRVLFRGREAVIDLKTGMMAPWHHIQTMAYAKCFSRPMLRFSLYLGEGGVYKLSEHTNPDDWDVFRSALLIVNWKRRNGLKI